MYGSTYGDGSNQTKQGKEECCEKFFDILGQILLWITLRITALPTIALFWFTMVILRLKYSLAIWLLTRTQHLNVACVF